MSKAFHKRLKGQKAKDQTSIGVVATKPIATAGNPGKKKGNDT